MSFNNLVLHILTSYKSSIQNSLENFFEKAGYFMTMSKQSFSEARHKIKSSAFIELFKMTSKLAYRDSYDTWHKYLLLAVDGTTLALPMDKKLVEHYGTVGSGQSSPTARASVIFDILNKVIITAEISAIEIDERSLLMRHLEFLKEEFGSFHKKLILLDRGYPSFDLIHHFKENKIKFVMRVRKKFNLEIDAQTAQDGFVVLENDLGEKVRVRVIKVKLPTGEIETLITNLRDERMGDKAFKELYFKRWGVETKYDDLKNKLEIENFSGRSVQAIEQDFYASMYLSNLAAAACWEAQMAADIQRIDKNNKYDYFININHAVGVIKDRFISALLYEDTGKRVKEVSRIILLLGKAVSERRPNRTVERKKNVRMAKFHHNKKSTA